METQPPFKKNWFKAITLSSKMYFSMDLLLICNFTISLWINFIDGGDSDAVSAYVVRISLQP